jgi:hypothetical protein
MLEFHEPFIVDTIFRLPGLGLLVSPAKPIPHWLATPSLHTALLIIVPGTQFTIKVTGTIEEVVHDNQDPQRVLLLDLNPDSPIYSGDRLIVSEAPSELY